MLLIKRHPGNPFDFFLEVVEKKLGRREEKRDSCSSDGRRGEG